MYKGLRRMQRGNNDEHTSPNYTSLINPSVEISRSSYSAKMNQWDTYWQFNVFCVESGEILKIIPEVPSGVFVKAVTITVFA